LTLALFRHAPATRRPRATPPVLSPFDDSPERENGREHMESIRGKQACHIGAVMLAARLAGYREVLVDIGTGDGRYVRHVAQRQPTWFAIGIDACRENLRAVSRRSSANALFLIANALALPDDLRGVATRITINFPWGSLLRGLLDGDPALFTGLATLARPGATLEIRLNGGALVEAGYALDAGVTRIQRAIRASGFSLRQSAVLDADALRIYPTTWAKRLAYGRDPRAWYLSATRRATCAGQKGDAE
jgi:16S rRNA (adenine(1408)-N(1))-methyltransferase